MGTIRRYYADGSTYTDKSTKDVWQRINGHWVRMGNVRDEGAGGIVGVAPRVNLGFNMAVALSRTQFLGSVLMDLGFSNGVDHVDRIRLINASMGFGYATAVVVQRVRYLAANMHFGADLSALLTIVAAGTEEIEVTFEMGYAFNVPGVDRSTQISANMAMGFNQSTALSRTQQAAGLMALGFNMSAVLTHQTLEYISASMDMGFDTIATLSRIKAIAANMAFGFDESAALSRTQQAASAMAMGFDMAAVLSHNVPAALSVLGTTWKGGTLAEGNRNNITANPISFTGAAVVVAIVSVGGSNSSNYNNPSFTDSDGVAWTAGPAFTGNTQGSGLGTTRHWYFWRAFTGSKSNLGGTAAWTTAAAHRAVALIAIAGADASNPIETLGSSSKNSLNPGSPPSLNARPSVPGDVIDITAMYAQNGGGPVEDHASITTPSGFTVWGNRTSASTTGADGIGNFAYKIQSSAYTGVITWANNTLSSGFFTAVISVRRA